MKQLRLVTLIFSVTIFSACSHSSFYKEQPAPAPTQAVEPAPPQVAAPTETTPTPINADTPAPVDDASASIEDVSKSPMSYIDQKYGNENTPKAAATNNTTKTIESSDAETTSDASSNADATPAPNATPVTLKKPIIAPEKAVIYLKHGNARFLKGRLRKDGQSKKDIKRLAKAQKPFVAIFTTSDSRVSPEIIFDEKLGEIYVVRNFGLSVDNSVINSLEYAVRYLGVGAIVVLDRNYDGKNDKTHAKEVIEKIFAESSMLQNYDSAGDLKIIPAVYHLENGKVDFGG